MTHRIYQSIPLAIGTTLSLDADARHHVMHVLRAHFNESIILFNGNGQEFIGNIVELNKKEVKITLTDCIETHTESPLHLILAQGISRGEKMDYTIQKAVELGVQTIIPLFTQRSTVKLDADRLENRWQHWQSVIIHACEQSGRTRIPTLVKPHSYATFIDTCQTYAADQYFIFTPSAHDALHSIPIAKHARILLLIGPEGGLSDTEVQQSLRVPFKPLRLGPRILRTETAAVVALTALQCYAGDLA